MSAQISSSKRTSATPEEKIEIKYIYLMVKILLAAGKLKKRKPQGRFFSEKCYEIEHQFQDKNNNWWSLDIYFNESKDVVIYLRQEAWKIDEPVFNFCSQYGELQFINKRELALDVNWIEELERLAQNDLETEFMSVKR